MSTTVGRRLLRSLCRTQLKQLARPLFTGANCALADKSESEKETPSAGTLPEDFSAAVLRKFSEPLVIEKFDSIKHVKDNEVLIDVHYCALNASDALLSRNLYTFTPELPTILGYEVVGKVLKVGEDAEKSGYQVGDKVVAIKSQQCGGLAEQCVAHVSDLWKLPSTIKSLDAVSYFDSYIKALLTLETDISVQENDILLVNVGINGLGIAMVDLASNILLGKVISVCSTEEGATLSRGKGAYTSLKFKEKNVLKQVQEVASEINIKEIFDDAGHEQFKKILAPFNDIYKKDISIKDLLQDDTCSVAVHPLSTQGRVLIFGNVFDQAKIDAVAENGGPVIRTINFQKIRREKSDTYRQAGLDIIEFIEEGFVRPTKSLIAGLNKVDDALKFMFENKIPGKVIVDIRDKEANATQILEKKDL